MSSRTCTVVHLSTTSDIDELVAQIAALPGQHVFVTVEETSDALLTAPEFFRVARAARDSEVGISISTEDPLRLELASILGWGIVPPGSQGADPKPQTAATADLATYRPAEFPPIEQPGQPDVQDRTTALPIAPVASDVQPAARTLPEIEALARARAARRLQESPATSPANATEQPIRITRRSPRRTPVHAHRFEQPLPTRRRSRGELALFTTTCVVLLLVAAFGAMDAAVVLLPSASIELVPAERTIAIDLVYGIAKPGAAYDITLSPNAVEHTVTVSRQIPSTGERVEPDGTASGAIQFLNPTTAPVAVPAGTRVKGANGATYATESGLSVPGADPFGSESMGSATVKVSAVAAGSDGNAGAAAVAGQLASGVYFKNGSAISGGTDKRIRVVAQADLDALRTAALSDLSSRAEPEFEQSLQQGVRFVPSSVTVGQPTLVFSQQPGDEADLVSVTGTETVSAQAFDPAKLSAQARDEVGRRLMSQVGPGATLIEDSLKVGEPKALDGGTSFTVQAEARVQSVISDEEQADLARRVVGRSLADAQHDAGTVNGVASARIDLRPSWLARHVQRMPRQAKRIKVHVDAPESRASSGP